MQQHSLLDAVRKRVKDYRLVIFAALFAAAIVVPVAGATHFRQANLAAPPPPGTVSFTDPGGDSGQAPDVEQVSADYQGAGYYLSISIQGGPGYLSDQMSFDIYLDTDQNPATGDPAGADYRFHDSGGHNDKMKLGRWANSAWDYATPQTSLHYNGWFTGGSLQFKPSDLGNTKGYNFWITTADAEHPTDTDSAPDAGLAHYHFTLPGAPPSAGCLVPNVKGKTVSAAKTRLIAAKCSLGSVKATFSNAKKGRVVKQSQRAGSHLALNARVNLVVSRGRKH